MPSILNQIKDLYEEKVYMYNNQCSRMNKMKSEHISPQQDIK